MSCDECGRGDGHWLGCERAAQPAADNRAREIKVEGVCEHSLCAQPTKAYSGRGAKPKYCDEHSDPKNRK
ncbi:hypothetical protein [Streptomyces misionensis]|uniref:hypothetical protein n=1 Tax=Streptomyces misionensis TaxID=67331 RepID=UPI0036812FA2